ncbi:hypothetical protein BN14_02732 [Rhizoctonia solani AG-1 IB]|uniref:Uncharacterized protein n=1 Tax=Thanatephorus cucumeris (strain AG1-IB / isolate 7/3/14) TaxID=1108050 RepID=M5BNT8_THACB|nr:hypothetical protein BN14_02732 [Rhizoctonia solani AG-1 IB]
MAATEGSAFGIIGWQVFSGFPYVCSKFPGGSFSAIYTPDGSQLVKPVGPGVEAILHANMSLEKIDEVKLVADNQSNYSCRNLFHLVVHNKGEYNWPAYESEKEQEVVNTTHGYTNDLTSLELKAVDEYEK